ncbi:MAG: PE family protein, partial [Mycobacterium sp.]
MSRYLVVAPEVLAAASGDLAGIEDTIKAAAAAAAPSTTGITAAAGDEVSAALAGFFGSYAQEFQTLSAQATQFHAQFVHTLNEAAAAYATAEAVSVWPLRALLQQAESLGIGRPLSAFNAITNAAGLGQVVNFGAPGFLTAPGTNGVSGVRIGFSLVQIPVAPQSFLGIPIPGFSYPAPALWYFPTQADGSVHATGTVYLQHGFSAIGWFYQPLAIQLAQQTNSVVVTPTIPSIPLPLGVYLSSTQMQ